MTTSDSAPLLDAFVAILYATGFQKAERTGPQLWKHPNWYGSEFSTSSALSLAFGLAIDVRMKTTPQRLRAEIAAVAPTKSAEEKAACPYCASPGGYHERAEDCVKVLRETRDRLLPRVESAEAEVVDLAKKLAEATKMIADERAARDILKGRAEEWQKNYEAEKRRSAAANTRADTLEAELKNAGKRAEEIRAGVEKQMHAVLEEVEKPSNYPIGAPNSPMRRAGILGSRLKMAETRQKELGEQLAKVRGVLDPATPKPGGAPPLDSMRFTR